MTGTPRALLETPVRVVQRYPVPLLALFRGRVASLQYLLIAQDKALVEHYSRQTGERWLLVAVNSLTGHVASSSIGCSLELAEVYLNVNWIATPPRA